MKRLLFLISLLILFVLIATKNSFGKGDKGIQFFEGSYGEALQKAKAAHKPLFIDIYASWCGPCKLLKNRTFTDKKVGEYFNNHFINISLDGEKGDGAILANKYKIQGYPTLIIIDGNEHTLLYELGYYKPNELLKLVKGYAGE